MEYFSTHLKYDKNPKSKEMIQNKVGGWGRGCWVVVAGLLVEWWVGGDVGVWDGQSTVAGNCRQWARQGRAACTVLQ